MIPFFLKTRLRRAVLIGAQNCVGTFSDGKNTKVEDFSMGPFLNPSQLRSRDEGWLIDLKVFKEEKNIYPGDWISVMY